MSLHLISLNFDEVKNINRKTINFCVRMYTLFIDDDDEGRMEDGGE